MIDKGKQPKWNVTLNKRWNWSSCRKLALSASWTHGLIAQSVRVLNGIQWFWVQIPLRPTFYSYFKESVSGEYHIYFYIHIQHSEFASAVSSCFCFSYDFQTWLHNADHLRHYPHMSIFSFHTFVILSYQFARNWTWKEY